MFELWYKKKKLSDTICRKNQNTHFMSRRQSGRKWQYGCALHSGLVRIHARKHTTALDRACAYACARSHTQKHTHTKARALIHTHAHRHTDRHARTDQYVILIAFPRQQWFSGLASSVSYTHIACIVIFLTLLCLVVPTLRNLSVVPGFITWYFRLCLYCSSLGAFSCP